MYEKRPMAIERQSMTTIDDYLTDVHFPENALPVVRRIIHTTGDVDYRHIIDMTSDFMERAESAIQNKAYIYTDTRMGRVGINEKALARSGCRLATYIADDDVAEEAIERKTTRSIVALEKGVKNGCNAFMIGNAPTALFRLMELYEAKEVDPDFVIAVPVGFVGAAEAKEKMGDYKIPSIRILGTKGGSNVAASILNALLYEVAGR